MKLLAQVPFDAGKSYDFYADRFICEDIELLYEDIVGYGYLLTNKSQSVDFIPLGNSTSYSVRLYAHDQEFNFGKTASNVMLFKNKKQRTIKLIFSEFVDCVQAFIAPSVFNNCLMLYQEQGWITLAKMTLTDNILVKKTVFGTKQLDLNEYGRTAIGAGRVKVYSSNNKLFYDCALSDYNAPLIGPILDTLTAS